MAPRAICVPVFLGRWSKSTSPRGWRSWLRRRANACGASLRRTRTSIAWYEIGGSGSLALTTSLGRYGNSIRRGSFHMRLDSHFRSSRVNRPPGTRENGAFCRRWPLCRPPHNINTALRYDRRHAEHSSHGPPCDRRGIPDFLAGRARRRINSQPPTTGALDRGVGGKLDGHCLRSAACCIRRLRNHETRYAAPLVWCVVHVT